MNIKFFSCYILCASNADLRKEEGEIAITLQRGVVNRGFAGLMSVLMTKDAAFAESKFLPLPFIEIMGLGKSYSALNS